MKTEAIKKGDKYIINGSKTFITNAPVADLFFVYAKTEETYSAFVILKNDDGFKRGKSFKKMGMRGSPTGEIFFDNVAIPEERIIGEYGKAKDIIMSGLNIERVILSHIFTGLSRRALDIAIDYSIMRKQFGKSISDFELIQDKIAVMYSRYEASKLLCKQALSKIENDRMDVFDAATALLFATESAEYISREAIQIMGGYGYIKDGEVEMLLRDSILGQIGGGTKEIRKKLIASSIVKNFKEGRKISE